MKSRYNNTTVGRNKGFTLIELLVVISIISFLASMVFASLNNARMSARDTQRLSDMRQMRIALELYRSTNGDYPHIPPWVYSTDSSWDTLQTALAPYMPVLPRDPINSGPNPWAEGNYSYAYSYDPANPVYLYNANKRYDLVLQFERKSNPLRCGVRKWITGWNENVWCESPNNWTEHLYTGEY